MWGIKLFWVIPEYTLLTYGLPVVYMPDID